MAEEARDEPVAPALSFVDPLATLRARHDYLVNACNSNKRTAEAREREARAARGSEAIYQRLLDQVSDAIILLEKASQPAQEA